MGITYEMNWYLVASDKKEIVNIGDNLYSLKKTDRRIYPIDSEIPLIIKNIGCISMVKISKIEIDKYSTNIIFSISKNYGSNDLIAKHYYDAYKNMYS